MNAMHSSTFVPEIPAYADLQREIHYALRAQHPEWIEEDGSSPTCDTYESRLAELLSLSLPIESAHNERGSSIRSGMLRKTRSFSNSRHADMVLI